MVKILTFFAYVSITLVYINAEIYDISTGQPVSQTKLELYTERNNVRICTVDVKLPCDPTEWRRTDGTCNNLNSPSTGSHRTPTIRLLAPVFSQDYEPRTTKDGLPLPSSRHLRTNLLRTGKSSDLGITQLVSFYLSFMIGDIVNIQVDYIKRIPYCCKPQGKYDPRCIPIKIPIDDPVHRFSGIKCMNLTRHSTLQSYECLENDAPIERITSATSTYDLSNIYNYLPGFDKHIRAYKNGLLKIEEENGKLFPPSDNTSEYCILNERPRETRCHKYNQNKALGSNILSIIFYRYHNYIANELYKLNPCWDDDLIFYTARDINIAISQQIYLYELLPVLLGKKNMVRDGIISPSEGYRDIYDEAILPKVTEEYLYIQRWFHTTQETNMKFFDKDGYYVKGFPMVNCTGRTGFLAVDDNIDQIIQGSFRQSGGRFDYTIDYDMADRFLGGMQITSDSATIDLMRGRYYGFQPYIRYRKLCSNRPHMTFSDFLDVIRPERIHRLRQKYRHPKDVELLAAVWTEEHIRGGRVPVTVYCLMADQLKRSIVSDRHWYERKNRPHAFSIEQLKSIRNVTIAGILCAVGDSVTKIQPRAFHTISKMNHITDCSSSEIGKFDVTPWLDPSCDMQADE